MDAIDTFYRHAPHYREGDYYVSDPFEPITYAAEAPQLPVIHWRDLDQDDPIRCAVEAFTRREVLHRDQVRQLAYYLTHWIDAPGWEDGWEDGADENSARLGPTLDTLRNQVSHFTTRQDIEAWLACVLSLGIDPL